MKKVKYDNKNLILGVLTEMGFVVVMMVVVAAVLGIVMR